MVDSHRLWGEDLVDSAEIDASCDLRRDFTEQRRFDLWKPVGNGVDEVLLVAALDHGRFSERPSQVFHSGSLRRET